MSPLAPLHALRRRLRQWFHARLPRTDTLLLTQRNVYILPTRAGWMLALTLLLLLVGSINYQRNLGYLLTFLLAGPATKNRRSHWLNDSTTANADEWFDTATEVKGSWWPVWADWLKRHNGGEVPARSRLGSKDYPPGEPAPGSYVKEKA